MCAQNVYAGIGENMDIRSISIYSNQMNNQKSAVTGNSFLDIGKKGQVVQGEITSVSDQLTINFNGIEIAVAKNAVSNAKEGEVRDFQITDVSKDSIALKEVGSTAQTQQAQSIIKTSVAPTSYSFDDYLENSKNAAQAQADKSESLTILNGEDYEAIEDEEGSFEKTNQESVERAVERIKSQKAWKSERMEEYHEFRDNVEQSQEKAQAEGFAYQKTEAQIRSYLEEAGIPTTQDSVAKVMSAMGMSETALDLNDQSKLFIVGQDLAPTIDNLYQGKFSVYGVADASTVATEEFADYQEQIEGILEGCNRTSDADYTNAQWLFANELPINEATLDKLSTLENIQETMTSDKVLTQIVYAMLAGAAPKDAILDERQFVVARDAVHDFESITDGTIIQVSDYILQHVQTESELSSNQDSDLEKQGADTQENTQILVNLALLSNVQEQGGTALENTATIPTVYTSDMTESEIMQVTLKRQLVEIQKKLTLQSAISMEQKGIHIETESLDKIIEELREIENAYYSKQVAGDAVVENDELNLLQETLSKTDDVASAHASVLGGSVRQQALLTLNELHAATNSTVAQKSEWQGTYETVSTQVRSDLGDDIKKAFSSIPSILEEIGMEDTQTNERAARILGYNSMEITEENINQVKALDAKVNTLLENTKPTTVLSLIREGSNPLDMPIDELNEKLKQINEKNGITEEEKYSRFIWQLEKSGEITEEERTGYIGMYRLLNQLQSLDGAEIGAVLESNQELTLGNLLTQSRTRKGNGVNTVVDETHGFTEKINTRESITDQIEKGFSANEYYQSLMEATIDRITPEKLQEITDGDMESLLDMSVEHLWEKVKQASDNKELKKEYFEEQAKEIRETFSENEEVQTYLSNLNVSDTLEHVIAAKNIIEGGYVTYKEAYNRKWVLEKEEQEELDEVIEDIGDSIDDEGLLDAQCKKAEKIMEDVLAKSYEQADITIEDLNNLKQLSRGMHFTSAIRQSKSYDIPIKTGDSVTSLNLTIIRGADESGKIQISMEDEEFGDVSMEFKVSGSDVKGLVLCNQRQGYESLQDQKDTLTQNLVQAGYQVKNISYGMDFKSRNEMLSEKVSKEQADTQSLYQVSKLLVRSVVTAMKEENE